MFFKQTYKIYDTGYQRDKYYYIDNKRVSSEKFYWESYQLQLKGLIYNSSYLKTKNNGRIEAGYYLD